MKTYIYLCFLLLFILVFTPALAIPADISMTSEEIGSAAVEKVKSVLSDSVLEGLINRNEDSSKDSSDADGESEASDVSSSKDETIEVMLHASGESVNLSMKEYLCGAVAGEMPAVYDEEALKAQTVACYTYAKAKEASGVTITDNPSVNQSYLSKDELKEKWGDKFETYYERIENAVDSVLGEYLTYDGQLVNTVAYHAISSGKTESAAEIWGGDPIPYLVSVDSSVDKLSPDYKVTTVFTLAQLKEKLTDAGINCDFAAYSDKDVVGEITRTSGGAVEKIEICGVSISGSDFRTALNLRSLNYYISVKSETFTISTLGYGHGVGMSQYGANALALDGWNYKKILKHYYPGTEIG